VRRILRSRYRISAQLYAGIGGAVLLTIAASVVGWFSFDRVGNAQTSINEGTVPQLASAFGVARYAGALDAAGPRLTAATTHHDFAAISAEIQEAHKAFEAELAILEQTGGDDALFPEIRSHADALIENIAAITQDKDELFALNNRGESMLTDLAGLRADLDRMVVPALDDQLFYTMTGYREIGEKPSPRPEHLSEAQLARYRHLAELQADGNIASQLLTSAFNAPNPSSVEPLRERFEAAGGRIERSLSGLEAALLRAALAPVYEDLIQLGLDEGSGFDLIAQQLRLTQRQRQLLALNRDISVELVLEVDSLVAAAEVSSRDAIESSAQAMFAGRTLLLAISGISIGGALLIAWFFVGRVILRRLQMLSDRMRGMASGDLESGVEVGGSDEIADMAAALEVFRRHALEVQRLNLVEKLAEELQDKNEELETVLTDLRRAQDQIVMREKLAALGELTAGVAHEIRNPLNFVKNFSEASEDLLAELKETLEESAGQLAQEQQALVSDISGELVSNLERIRTHGERADRIVHDMLMMGRGSGEYQLTDLNRLLDQNTRLAFHSARALDPDFQLSIQEDMDPEAGKVSVVPQDLGRVFLNMVANACDATSEKRLMAPPDLAYEPTLWLATRRDEDGVEIRIRDNGNGIPPDIADKIFNPFFTTKPTDKGTGLGLAISNDIVRQHGGAIRVDTQHGEFTEMTIQLPSKPVAFGDMDTDTQQAAVAEPC
jgi:signal transduction histidine kinase